jgi:hypothetical protein
MTTEYETCNVCGSLVRVERISEWGGDGVLLVNYETERECTNRLCPTRHRRQA